MNRNNLRFIALYLPQYHPIKENEEWHGKGFTDWYNVAKGKPRYKNHYQPKIPTETGFYDLRLEDVHFLQQELAKSYGIEGFCYYHYWFHGKLLLEKPVEIMKASTRCNLKYMFCWANAGWYNMWEGNPDDVLLEQAYSKDDDIKHFNYLLPFFEDKNYIKVDKKPVMAIGRTELIPKVRQTIALWKKLAVEAGLPGLYVINFELIEPGVDPEEVGCDASAEFQPCFKEFANIKYSLLNKIFSKFRASFGIKKKNKLNDYLLEYKKIIDLMQNRTKSNFKKYPCVMPGWDNSARRESEALIIKNSTPELYEGWLENVIEDFEPYSDDENFIFINAWNEWAEGAYLEPCKKWGNRYLEATYRAKVKSQKQE
jgi:lipopolysaccharide biosynthesis protein